MQTIILYIDSTVHNRGGEKMRALNVEELKQVRKCKR